MNWKINTTHTPKLRDPIFIEGLPGIGNVGKIAVDLLIDETKAKRYMSLFSHALPNSVFVNEKNLVELPKIELYVLNTPKHDFLFLTGDVQPQSEEASYHFAEKLLDILQDIGCKKIITLGGIGLQDIPEAPNVYCTGNNKTFINQFKDAKKDVYGFVGPIVGISGLLLGLAKQRKMHAVSLLAETFGHPMYVGLKGAKETLKILKKNYNLKFSMKDLNEEIKDMEKEMAGETGEEDKPQKKKRFKYRDMNYIG